MIHVNICSRVLLIYRPRRDERLSWLTRSGQLMHKVVTCQSQIGRRAGRVHRPETNILTTESRCQPYELDKHSMKCATKLKK